MAPIDGFYQGLGDRVRHWRRDRGLTQAEVGARLSPPVTRASIANLELGQQRVLAHTLVQLAEVLSVTIDDLVQAGPAGPEAWSTLEAELADALQLPVDRASKLLRRIGGPRA